MLDSFSASDGIHKIKCYDGSERMFRTLGIQFDEADFTSWSLTLLTSAKGWQNTTALICGLLICFRLLCESW